MADVGEQAAAWAHRANGMVRTRAWHNHNGGEGTRARERCGTRSGDETGSGWRGVGGMALGCWCGRTEEEEGKGRGAGVWVGAEKRKKKRKRERRATLPSGPGGRRERRK